MSLTLNRISNLMALAVPAAGFFTCGKAGAASDFFFKFDGIDGESAVSGYEKQIEILSWSFGASNASTVSGGAGSGKVSMQDFHFTTRVNSSSPPLMLACAKGTHIPTATFRLLKPTSTGGQQEYYVVTLHDVIVSSYSSSRSPADGATSDGVPVEKISLSFIKIQMEYRPAASGGAGGNPVTATVDVER